MGILHRWPSEEELWGLQVGSGTPRPTIWAWPLCLSFLVAVSARVRAALGT